MRNRLLAIGLIGSIALFTFFVLASSHHAFADQNENDNEAHVMTQSASSSGSDDNQSSQNENEQENEGMHIGNAEESATLRPNGDFKVTGATVNSVDASSNSVNASLYGLSRTVSLNGAAITGGEKSIAIGDIQAGDKLSASGNWNESTHAVTVSKVNDETYGDRYASDIQGRINQLLQLVHQLQAQLESLGGH